MAINSNRMLRIATLWTIAVIVVACVAMTVYAVGASLRPVAAPPGNNNQEAPTPANIHSVVEQLELPEPQWLKEETESSKENLLI